MGKLAFSLSLLLAFSALAFSTAYTGDGTFRLYHNDTVLSANSFLIKLDTIVWGYTEGSSAVVIKNYTFVVTRLGVPTQNVTLTKGQGYSVINGTRSVKITVNDTGYDSSGPGGFNVAPYALVSVASSPVGIAITNVKIGANYYDAVINWTANVSSNGTVRVFDNYTNSPVSTASDGSGTAHSISAHNLNSNSPYYATITACTMDGCANSGKYNFTTKAVIPVINNVTVLDVTDTDAQIYWTTDVESDESLFYRAKGQTSWTQVPPPSSPWDKLSHFVMADPGQIYIPSPNPGDPMDFGWSQVLNENGIDAGQIGQQIGGQAYQAPKEPVIMLSAMGSGSAIPKGGFVNPAFSGGMYNAVKNAALVALLERHEHQIYVSDLVQQTDYEFIVSSCADKCANSTIYNFTTKRTISPPRITISGTGALNHGTSEVITVDVHDDNPGGKVLNATVFWHDGGTSHSLPVHFGASNYATLVPASMPYRAIESITFADTGLHQITVMSVNNFGKIGNATFNVNVKATNACKGTNAKYYPETDCTNKWPNDPQGTITYNTPIGECHAFEVCSDDLDYALADAETCCNGDRLFSDRPPVLGPSLYYDKNAVCDKAVKETRKEGAMTTLGSESSMKLCKAKYLVYGVGSGKVYMKDYYDGEFCCVNDAGICNGIGDVPFTAKAFPWSNNQFSNLSCYTFDPGIGGKITLPGYYTSDTDYTANNNAALDMPAHSSVNRLNSGTCVDYSFVVTTLLRKAGYGPGNIMSMGAPGHAYNLVYLPGAKKYSFIDTVGNTGGDFFTGPGFSWSTKNSDGVYKSQNHCTYTPDSCSNDYGKFACPAKKDISGC